MDLSLVRLLLDYSLSFLTGYPLKSGIEDSICMLRALPVSKGWAGRFNEVCSDGLIFYFQQF